MDSIIIVYFINSVLFLFFVYLIGNSLINRFWKMSSLREGLTTDETTDETADITPPESVAAPESVASPPESVATAAVVDELCKITESNKPIELAAVFEKVNKQTDMIRSLNESTDTVIPIKIDKNADANFLILANLKLLANNGIGKNEASLKAVYDQYIGNREIALLLSDLNSLKLESSNDANLHAKEEPFLCRVKTIIDGHQTLIDSILEKKSNE
jgi:hypothetical protein